MARWSSRARAATPLTAAPNSSGEPFILLIDCPLLLQPLTAS
jgi:hypothetical protein